jgi:hypothetical protein
LGASVKPRNTTIAFGWFIVGGEASCFQGTIEQRRNMMKWLWAALLTSTGILSAQAYTCADVRALSEEKQAYYIRVLNITPAQQQRIRRECYGPKASTGHFAHRQWDASVER